MQKASMDTKEYTPWGELERSKVQRAKGIIFDLDGTLIDSVADICKFSNKVLKEYGFETHALDKYIDWIGNGARKLMERAIPKEVDSATFEKIYREYLLIYEHDDHTESVLYEGISELLDYLNAHDVPIAILTNKPHKVMLKTVKSYFSRWHFVKAEGQQDGKAKKPNPSGALEIATLMKLEPENLIFVGDSAVDVQTGNAAGMTSVCIATGYETRQNIIDAHPDIVVEKHSDLLVLFGLK